VRVVGLVLGGIGMLLALGGLFALGTNLSPLPHPKEGAPLVETGVYGVVRHPIYSGLILGAAGWALLHGSLLTLVLAGVLFVFFDIKSRREERWLARQFPAYERYRTRVRKLIPFIY
jgi:protein-S-isoprenylcysteine O-methyltransferase Ste14